MSAADGPAGGRQDSGRGAPAGSHDKVREMFDGLARKCGPMAASRVLPHLDSSAAAAMSRQVNRMARFVFSALISPGRILDVGCGAGEFYRRIPRWFRGSYVGVDLSAGMLGLFERERPVTWPRRLIRGDLMELSLDGEFTQVVAVGLTQYIEPHSHPAMLRRMADLMAPGGVLAVDFNIPAAPRQGFRNTMALMDQCGLTVTGVWSYGWLAQRVRSPWRLMMCVEELAQSAGVSRLPQVVGFMGQRLFLIARKL